jgi:hypothetical protein
MKNLKKLVYKYFLGKTSIKLPLTPAPVTTSSTSMWIRETERWKREKWGVDMYNN